MSINEYVETRSLDGSVPRLDSLVDRNVVGTNMNGVLRKIVTSAYLPVGVNTLTYSHSKGSMHSVCVSISSNTGVLINASTIVDLLLPGTNGYQDVGETLIHSSISVVDERPTRVGTGTAGILPPIVPVTAGRITGAAGVPTTMGAIDASNIFSVFSSVFTLNSGYRSSQAIINSTSLIPAVQSAFSAKTTFTVSDIRSGYTSDGTYGNWKSCVIAGSIVDTTVPSTANASLVLPLHPTSVSLQQIPLTIETSVPTPNSYIIQIPPSSFININVTGIYTSISTDIQLTLVGIHANGMMTRMADSSRKVPALVTSPAVPIAQSINMPLSISFSPNCGPIVGFTIAANAPVGETGDLTSLQFSGTIGVLTNNPVKIIRGSVIGAEPTDLIKLVLTRYVLKSYVPGPSAGAPIGTCHVDDLNVALSNPIT